MILHSKRGTQDLFMQTRQLFKEEQKRQELSKKDKSKSNAQISNFYERVTKLKRNHKNMSQKKLEWSHVVVENLDAVPFDLLGRIDIYRLNLLNNHQ
jgi:hypothetical protein